MGKLNVFNFLTLNGFYKGPNGDISWNKHNQDESDFAKEGVGADNILVFGRVTYEMMAGYWPSPMALENDPEVAKGMNSAEKIVFSSTLKKADWQNTKVLNGDLIEAITNLKKSAKDMTILGSGSIIAQLAEKNLIDSYQLMINPVAIGSGESIFKNISYPLKLKLRETRPFKSGVVLLSYDAAE